MLPESAPEGAVLLYEAAEAALVDVLGIERERASQAAYDIIRRILEACGGEYFYVPKDIRLAAHERDIKIWQSFTGHNHRELAREHGVTVQYVYQILARMREQEIARRQLGLF